MKVIFQHLTWPIKVRIRTHKCTKKKSVKKQIFITNRLSFPPNYKGKLPLHAYRCQRRTWDLNLTAIRGRKNEEGGQKIGHQQSILEYNLIDPGPDIKCHKLSCFKVLTNSNVIPPDCINDRFIQNVNRLPRGRLGKYQQKYLDIFLDSLLW